MDTYTILFVLLLTIRGLEGQFQVADVRGPILLGNAKSFNGKGTSVVNIVNGYEVDKDHFLNSKGPGVAAHYKGPAVITDLGDDDTKSPSVDNVINDNKDQPLNLGDKRINGPVVTSIAGSNGPLVISGARPGSTWVQGYQRPVQKRPSITNARNNTGQWYQYPAQWPTKKHDRYY